MNRRLLIPLLLLLLQGCSNRQQATDIKNQTIVQSSFHFFNKVKDIPKFIVDYWEQNNGMKFTIADSGEEWHSACTNSYPMQNIDNKDGTFTVTYDTTKKLPDFELMYFARNDSVGILTYKSGGIGVSAHVWIMNLSGNKVTQGWETNMFSDIAAKDSLITAFVKGTLKQKTF